MTSYRRLSVPPHRTGDMVVASVAGSLTAERQRSNQWSSRNQAWNDWENEGGSMAATPVAGRPFLPLDGALQASSVDTQARGVTGAKWAPRCRRQVGHDPLQQAGLHGKVFTGSSGS